MIFRGVRGSKLECASNFRARRRHPAIVHNFLNKHQNLSLPRGEISHFYVPVYNTSLLVLYTAGLMSGSSGSRRYEMRSSAALHRLENNSSDYLRTLKVVSVEIAVLAALGNNG